MPASVAGSAANARMALRGGQMLLHAALMSLDAVQLLFERLQTLAAFILPMHIAFEFQIAVPGFDGVHHLAAIFHHNRFVEEHHGIVGS